MRSLRASVVGLVLLKHTLSHAFTPHSMRPSRAQGASCGRRRGVTKRAACVVSLSLGFEVSSADALPHTLIPHSTLNVQVQTRRRLLREALGSAAAQAPCWGCGAFAWGFHRLSLRRGPTYLQRTETLAVLFWGTEPKNNHEQKNRCCRSWCHTVCYRRL